MDVPILNSGTQTFSATGEFSFTPAAAQSGVGSVRLVTESVRNNYPCIGEIGVIGAQP